MFSEEVCYCRHDCCYPDGEYFDCDICSCHEPVIWEEEEDSGITLNDLLGD